MVDFTVLIPARAASTRLPGKMLADIAGKPLILRTAQRAMQSNAKRLCVATDDQAIYQVVSEAGIEVVMTDPSHPSGTDRLAEVARLLGLDSDQLIVNVQGDEPLIEPDLINQVAQCLASQPEAAMATAAYPIRELKQFTNPHVVKVVLDQAQRALYFSRAPIPWPRDDFATDPTHWPEGLVVYHHIGIYAYRADFLQRFPQLPQGQLERWESLEQLRALEQGYRIQVLCSEQTPASGVDSPEDLAAVRALFAAQSAQSPL